MIKMNALLAKNQQTQSQLEAAVKQQAEIFQRHQDKFKGCHNTHVGKNEYASDASKNKNVRVTTTVDEQLVWLEQVIIPALNDVMAVEHTNSANANKVALVCDGTHFGEFTAIELMRIKNILNSKTLAAVYNNIPVRSDSVVWEPSTDEDYIKRGVVQTPMIKEVTRTTLKEQYILKDPNVNPEIPNSNYRPAVVTKDTTVETGDATRQDFSGEWTQQKKAEVLKRLSSLKQAVVLALSQVNEVEAIKPNYNLGHMFAYLHGELIGR